MAGNSSFEEDRDSLLDHFGEPEQYAADDQLLKLLNSGRFIQPLRQRLVSPSEDRQLVSSERSPQVRSPTCQKILGFPFIWLPWMLLDDTLRATNLSLFADLHSSNRFIRVLCALGEVA